MLVLKYLPEGNLLIEPDLPDEFESIFKLRWQILRKPWDQPKGSEQDSLEYSCIHRAVFSSNGIPAVLACGRIQKMEDSEFAQIRYMAVHADFRNKGLGFEVLKSLEQAMVDLNLRVAFLNARENAVPFYLKAGYMLEHEIPPFLGIRHFRMRKILNDKILHQ